MIMTFIFKQWENRVPYFALMKLEESKICLLEKTWGKTRKKGLRVALAATLGGGWTSVIKEAGKQTFKHGSRKALASLTLSFLDT
jgi:hypothetical protein